MGGSANIGTNLVDSLLSMVDDLRGSLNPDMGVRQWRAYTRRRTWTGARVGDGVASDVDVELTPQPLVEPDARFLQPIAAGMDEMGSVTLSEISLTYTEAELTGSPVLGNQEWFIVLKDAQGQHIRERLYQLMEPPKPDRVQTIGWKLKLKLSTDTGCP